MDDDQCMDSESITYIVTNAKWCDQNYGGYDLEFVDDFICQICTRVLCDSHLAVCCGQHFVSHDHV